MTEPLLPPDPTKPGRYWLAVSRSQPPVEFIADWVPPTGIWVGPLGKIYPRDSNYTLASPHPIPTAAQLDALHRLADDVAAIADGMENSMANGTVMHAFANQLRDRLRAALKGDR